MRRPSRANSAGTSVTAQAAAVTTVKTAASPRWPMKVTPDAYSPRSAMETVEAAMITAWPLVPVVRAAAATGSTPSAMNCRNRVVRKRA
jgi:hypothetical protein